MNAPMNLSRRKFVNLAAGLYGATLTRPLWSFANQDLPSPNFDVDEGQMTFKAGLRPYRKGSFRLEAERFADKLMIHNYGYGGAGISMSWGCALEVLDVLNSWRRAPSSNLEGGVAVLGAGVMGLTAAYLIREQGIPVTVYARGFRNETTSAIAGGLWAPVHVAYPKEGAGFRRYERIIQRAFKYHCATIGQDLGAVRRSTYSGTRLPSLELMPHDLIAAPESLTRLPFAGHTEAGYRYESLLIEPLRLLSGLETRLRLAGVRLERQEFHELSELHGLAEPVVINCLGLGAREVFADGAMTPLKGQLCHLPPQPQLSYLYTGNGYIFPRSDSVVIGGTLEPGVEDPTPDPDTCRRVFQYARAAFTGQKPAFDGPPVRPALLERFDGHGGPY